MGKKLFKTPTLRKSLGITKAKRSIAKSTGIPTTKSGRKAKAKRLTNPLSLLKKK